MQKFRIYNAYQYLDKKTNEKKVVIEALNVGKETRFPKKVFLTVPQAEQLLGSQLSEEFGLGFSGKVLVEESLYALEDAE